MPDREAFHIGPFQIGDFRIDIPVHWYGIMIMLGVLAASYMALREAKRRREDPDHVWQMFPWVLIAGIVGARAGFVISQLGDPRYHDIGNWFRVWEGGLSIQGAIVGGVLALVLYCNRYHISFFKWTDIIVPGLALAQAIGRWGNFFNQEAFGAKCDLPWCIPISAQRQTEVAGITNPNPSDRFHPTFAYEMIWDLLNFGLLMWLGRQKKIRLREGDLLWVYLIVYSLGRFAIELIRLDSATVGGLKTPAVIAIATIVIAWTMLIYRHRPNSGAPYSESNLTEEELAQLTQRSTTGSRRPARARTDATTTAHESRVRKVTSFAQPDTGAEPPAKHDPMVQATEGQSE